MKLVGKIPTDVVKYGIWVTGTVAAYGLMCHYICKILGFCKRTVPLINIDKRTITIKPIKTSDVVEDDAEEADEVKKNTEEKKD